VHGFNGPLVNSGPRPFHIESASMCALF